MGVKVKREKSYGFVKLNSSTSKTLLIPESTAEQGLGPSEQPAQQQLVWEARPWSTCCPVLPPGYKTDP